MRNAILRMPAQRTSNEQRQVLRAARQLRADLDVFTAKTHTPAEEVKAS